MPNIEHRSAIGGLEVSQSQEVNALVLIIGRNIGETLTPRPICIPVQSFRKTLPQLDLQSVVVVPAGIVDIVQTAIWVALRKPSDEWVEQEKVNRIRARRVCRWQDARARTEGAAEHTANIVLVVGKSRGQRAGRAVRQIVDKGI